jgi:phage host-nuclease inhibitor protein Gam
MHERLGMKLLKLKHGFESERTKIRQEKDLFIEKVGKNTKMNNKIAKTLKDYQYAINQLNGKIRTLKQWLAK